MIYTCTLNPSVDYQIQTDSLEIGHLNRVADTAFYPGGKGINVSRVLNHLNTDSIALGFVGGFTGQFLVDTLSEMGIETDFVEHETPTRVNVKIKTEREETEVNGTGALVSEIQQKELLKKLEGMAPGDYLILSGSRPPTIPFSLYKSIVEIASDKQVELIIDIPDAEIKELLSYRPFLIKPNEFELAKLTGNEIKNKQDAVQGAKELIRMGVQHVIVSLGADGAVLVNDQQVLQAKSPEGTLISSVGAGDSLVAGFIASFITQQNITQAFRQGVSAGTATAYSAGLCQEKDVHALIHQVIISEWKGV